MISIVAIDKWQWGWRCFNALAGLDSFFIAPHTYAHISARSSRSSVTSPRHSTKRSTNVYLTASLVDKARSMDMNLSATLDNLLTQAIEAKKYQREKEKEDLQTMNVFMAQAGMLTDDEYFGSL
ncbi:hypothetical protein EPYR_01630 [Erwinia pyrifoliae DSM 12163]|nr:post-segregation antitoxin-like protein [Erwinia pyrifoliae]CAY74010.1 hypothetical protein EPYR_01630 [Erwinia pyrifoliae DSM 12163]